MDGLLVDSEPVWTIAEDELAARLGGVFTPAIKAAMIGTRLDVAVPTMLAHLGSDADPAEGAGWLVARVGALFRAELPLHAGAIELLDSLAAAGVPVALVSSSYRALVDAALETLGADRFAVTVAGDEVRHGKPHPDPYLTAANLLGVDPACCVVV